MKLLKYLPILAGILFILSSHPVSAITVVSSNGTVAKTDPEFLITGYSFTASRLNYVQIYNQSDEVQSLDGWQLSYTLTSGSLSQTVQVPVLLTGLMKPQSYILIADSANGFSSPFEYSATIPTPDDTYKVASIQFIPPADAPYNTHLVSTPTLTSANSCSGETSPVAPNYSLRRNISSSTGNYLSTFCYFIPKTNTTIYMDELYDFPASTTLQISEIVPNARNCSPLDTDLDCQDYVKLYNSGTLPVDLDKFRLRNGYLGQTPSTSNTTQLRGVLVAGHYIVISTNVTNSDSWLWLEDTYGIHRYDDSVTSYPDASSDSKKGQAWAYDETDGMWKWTTQPSPLDGPSIFLSLPVVVKETVSTLTPCREDQYRSEETNRCRSIAASAVSSLTACKEGQYRSEDTNRCRSVLSAVAELVPCREGQERSPSTNRCQNVISTDIPKAAFAVQSVQDAGKAFVGWWALGGIGAFAIGYALWEWRQEIMIATHRIRSVWKSSK